MLRRKQLLSIFLLATPVVLVLVLLLGALITEAATAYAPECQNCHGQLASKVDMSQCEAGGKTFYSRSDDGLTLLKGWSMTSDLPNWNPLIDERPLVLETDE